MRPQKKGLNIITQNLVVGDQEALADDNDKDGQSQTMTTANGDDVVVACFMVIGVAGCQRGKCHCPTSILECATNAGNARAVQSLDMANAVFTKHCNRELCCQKEEVGWQHQNI